jgi:hypothetical protein
MTRGFMIKNCFEDAIGTEAYAPTSTLTILQATGFGAISQASGFNRFLATPVLAGSSAHWPGTAGAWSQAELIIDL